MKKQFLRSITEEKAFIAFDVVSWMEMYTYTFSEISFYVRDEEENREEKNENGCAIHIRWKMVIFIL